MLRTHRFRDFSVCKAASLVALILIAMSTQGGI